VQRDVDRVDAKSNHQNNEEKNCGGKADRNVVQFLNVTANVAGLSIFNKD